VAVEKLFSTKFAKIKLRQEALQSIFSGRLDIFYPPNFGCLGRKVSFSTATGVYTQNPRPEVSECNRDLSTVDPDLPHKPSWTGLLHADPKDYSICFWRSGNGGGGGG
jgi:hypothetical protein